MALMTAAECARISNKVSTPSDGILEKCLEAALSRIRSYAEASHSQCDLCYGDIRVRVSLHQQNRQVVMDYVTHRLLELGYCCFIEPGTIRVSWAHALKAPQEVE